MADLPRVALLWLLHFVLPPSTLRYAFFSHACCGPLESMRLQEAPGSHVVLLLSEVLCIFVISEPCNILLFHLKCLLYSLWTVSVVMSNNHKNKLFYFAFLSFLLLLCPIPQRSFMHILPLLSFL